MTSSTASASTCTVLTAVPSGRVSAGQSCPSIGIGFRLLLMIALGCGGIAPQPPKGNPRADAGPFSFRFGADLQLGYSLECGTGVAHCSSGTASALARERPPTPELLAYWEHRGRCAADEDDSAHPAPSDFRSPAWVSNETRERRRRYSSCSVTSTPSVLPDLGLATTEKLQRFAAYARRSISSPPVHSALQQLQTLLPQRTPPNVQVVLVQVSDADAELRAEQFEDIILLEVHDPEDSARLPVLAHEFVHYLFAHAEPEALRQAMTIFENSDSPFAASAWGYFDEVLATALGGMLFERTTRPAAFQLEFADPRAFYNDAIISSMARMLFQHIDAELSRSHTPTLTDLAAAHLVNFSSTAQALPLRAHLRPMVCAGVGDFPNALQKLASGGNAECEASLDASAHALLAAHPRWGAVVMAHSAKEVWEAWPDTTPLLSPSLREADAASHDSFAMILASPTSERGFSGRRALTVFLVAPNDSEMSALVEGLLQSRLVYGLRTKEQLHER